MTTDFKQLAVDLLGPEARRSGHSIEKRTSDELAEIDAAFEVFATKFPSYCTDRQTARFIYQWASVDGEHREANRVSRAQNCRPDVTALETP